MSRLSVSGASVLLLLTAARGLASAADEASTESSSAVADSVAVRATKSSNPGDVLLPWTGQSGSVTVYRASSPLGVASPGNRLGTSASLSWIDSPPAQPATFYDVRNVACSGAGAGPVVGAGSSTLASAASSASRAPG